MERRELERQIVEKEWLMFQQVQGVNGRAACQDAVSYTHLDVYKRQVSTLSQIDYEITISLIHIKGAVAR